MGLQKPALLCLRQARLKSRAAVGTTGGAEPAGRPSVAMTACEGAERKPYQACHDRKEEKILPSLSLFLFNVL